MNQKIKKYFFTICCIFFFANGFSQSPYGFLNKKGEEVIPAKFELVGDFANGLAPAKLNGKWGYINKTGEYVIQPTYGYAENFKSGYAKIGNHPSSLYFDYVNTEGKVFNEYDILTEPFYFEGLKIVEANAKFGFRDVKGKVVIPAIYDRVFNFNGSGMTSAKKGDSYGLINKQGKELSPFEFDYVGDFEGGYVAVMNQTKETFIYDSTGNNIKISDVDMVYHSFNKDGLALFKKSEKFGLINFKGLVVIPPVYDWVTRGNNNIVAVKQNGIVSVIDIRNPQKTLSSFQPANKTAYFTFIDGLANFMTSNFELTGFCNIYGKAVIPAKYRSFTGNGFQEDLAGFQKYEGVAQTNSEAIATTQATQSPPVTTSGNISSSSYSLDLFSELGSMALYVSSRMYIVKIKG